MWQKESRDYCFSLVFEGVIPKVWRVATNLTTTLQYGASKTYLLYLKQFT